MKTDDFDVEFDGELEDNEYTFGMDSDGSEYTAEDHIREYMSDMTESEIEDFEDLCDSVED